MQGDKGQAQGPLAAYRAKVAAGELRQDEAQERAAEKLQELYARLTAPPKRGWFGRRAEPPKGLYFWGGVGRGKTMLMDLFYDSLPRDAGKRRVHFHEFMIEVHDYLHRERKKRASGDAEALLLKFARDVAAKGKILCFDEFHVTDIADAMILGRLFTALFREGVVVVATSNWPPHNLYHGGLQRELFLPFISLLQQRVETVAVDGPVDYRLQALSDSGVWLEAGDKIADALFGTLTDGAAPHAETLEVKGRKVPVARTAKGVARFSFSALCGAALGAEDYLAVAGHYHTVFLEDVPKLDDARRNETKRLMTLVDIFYDHAVRLVVTARAQPQDLYGGTQYAFEFERTVSRLIEMQGPAYLQRRRPG
jgi:cell division protein ZapE